MMIVLDYWSGIYMIDVRNRKPLRTNKPTEIKGLPTNASPDSALERMKRTTQANFGNSTRPNLYQTACSSPVYKPNVASDAEERRKHIQEIHDRQSTDTRIRNEGKQNRNRINMGTQTKGF